jgi:hypothetical protein
MLAKGAMINKTSVMKKSERLEKIEADEVWGNGMEGKKEETRGRALVSLSSELDHPRLIMLPNTNFIHSIQ